MKLLKILYICWMVFWGLACLLGIFMGHWGYRTSGEILIEMLFLYFALCLFPLLPYFYYLIYAKTRTKNIFVALFCYCLFFVVLAHYFSFIYSSDRFLEFFIIVTSYKIICIAIILYKFKLNLRLCICILLHIMAYFYIFLHIFNVYYEIEWIRILFDKDVIVYIYHKIIQLLYGF